MLPTDRTPVTIDGTPVPLTLSWMTGHEELGGLFEYELELQCPAFDVKFDALLGKPLSVCVNKSLGVRFFNGIVTRLSRVGTSDRYLTLRATLSPKLWLLTRTTDCRIYQNKSVPDVVSEVLKEHGITFSPKRLDAGVYKKWDYLTQYRESDFAFISRIMEREGIYYYFKHTKSDHELILSDSPTCHDSVAGYELIPVRPPGTTSSDRDHLTGWRLVHRITSLGATLQAHDFRLRRGADITAIKGAPAEHEQDDYQLYDYAGHYVGSQNAEAADAGEVRAAGEHYAQVRLEEQRVELEQVEGEGSARGLEAGALIKIEDLGAGTDKLLLIGTQHEIHNPDEQSVGLGAGSGTGEICHVSFRAISGQRQFRTARLSDRVMVNGPETATVVGTAGEEILTDPYGRVRVQFHWDREGKANESSTCWVRVGQMWAGSGWGSIYIPRIGQEVIVQFLGGDPDRPVIVGCLYNANNMPPYTLPTNATQSGIKSRSSKGGAPSNFNEIRFEDKKGKEQLFIQAEKNQDNLVKADASLSVGHDRTKSVGNNETVTIGVDRTETVGANETVTITANQTLSVGVNRSITVGSNQTETIGVAFAETVGAAKALTIGAAYQVSVGAAMNETIGGLKAEEIGGAKVVAVGAASSEKIGGSKSVTAGGDISESAGGKVAITAGKDASVTAGKNLTAAAADDLNAGAGKKAVVSAGEQLTLTCGDATIVLKKNGDIVINGNKITVKGSGDVVVKGSKIDEN